VHRALVAILLAGCSARLKTGASSAPDGALDTASPGLDATRDASSATPDGTRDASPVDVAPALTGSQFVAGYDMVTCNAAFACAASFPGTAAQFAFDFGTSLSSCYALAQQDDSPSVIDADVASGEIHFDAAKAAACLAGVGYDCATFWPQGLTDQATCSTAMVGSVPDGGACHVDWDCAWTSGCNAQQQCQPY
jgi:hypothetical protein